MKYTPKQNSSGDIPTSVHFVSEPEIGVCPKRSGTLFSLLKWKLINSISMWIGHLKLRKNTTPRMQLLEWWRIKVWLEILEPKM